MTAISALLKRFAKAEDGVALILVTLTLPALLGFALLAIDMSRVNSLHNDLQKAADAFALAAAAELDGRGDAETRAMRAINELLENQSWYSDNGGGGAYQLTSADIAAVNFLHSLPPSDTSAITADFHEETPEEMGFVEVIIAPTQFTTIIPIVFFEGSETLSVSASAVAGFTGTVVCEMTPLFICNPFETVGPFHEIAGNANFYKRGITLVSNDGNAGQWGPGNFGFIRPTDDHGYGAQDLASDIARSHLRECAVSNGINTRTGGPQPALRDAINVRFDIFAGSFNSASNDPTVPSAPNVRKGYAYKGGSTNACNMDPADDITQFPYLFQDSAPDLGIHSAGRIGNGLWDYEGYIAAMGYSASDMLAFVDEEGIAYSNANPPSRYDLYVYEIESGLVAQESPGGEDGLPACHSAPSTDPDRRLIYGAVVNCLEHSDDLNGQSGAPIPVEGFASFFLTEPVSQSRTNGNIMAEIVDIDGVQGRGTMVDFSRDMVQLYR